MKIKTITAALAIIAFIGIANASTSPKIHAIDSCDTSQSAEELSISIKAKGHCAANYAHIGK